MYCKNCGSEIDENASVCIKCGYAKNAGNSYCRNCGKEVYPYASICPACGVSQVTPSSKSRLLIGLMGIFFGTFGVHNFILGYTGKAVIQLCISLLTCGIGAVVVEIWALVEAINILCGNVNHDAYGNPLAD